MAADRPDVSDHQDPQQQLEQALIDEFLHRQGCERAQLNMLPVTQQKLLMTQASSYASGKLAEVDARAHFVHQMHGGLENAHKQTHR